MKIKFLYSHLNGHEYLLVHRKQQWEEVEAVIKSVDAEAFRTKESKEKRRKGAMLFCPTSLNKRFKELFEKQHWNERRTDYWVTDDAKLLRRGLLLDANEQRQLFEDAGKEPISSYNQVDFVKDRIAVEVQFGKYAFVAYDLFVKHLTFYGRDVIDVGVEILPTKKLTTDMSSGIGYYERELNNLIRQGRVSPPVPLVLLGVE